MKFKNRKEEAMAKFAAKEAERANKAAWEAQLAVMKEMKVPLLHPDHSLPKTRRDFLGAGLMSGIAYSVVPGVLAIANKKAYGVTAEDCKGSDGGDSANAAVPGYIHIELSGGASLAGNFVYGKQSAGAAFEPLNDYSTLGFGADIRPDGTANMDMTFGGPFHTQSRIMQGIKAVASAEAQARMGIGGIAGTSNDDSRNNPLNPIQLAVKTRADGALTTMAVQADTQNSGGRTAPLAIADGSVTNKAIVSDEDSLAGLVDPGLLGTRLTKDGALKIAEAASRLSESKLKAFNAKDLPSQVQELVACGYLGSRDLLSEFDQDSLAPSRDATLSGANFGQLTMAQINGDENQARALIMAKLCADGLAAGGTIEMAGYDYHGRGRDQQNLRDEAVGRMIGIIAEACTRKNVPVFIAVTSDGSTAATRGGNGHVAHRSDSGERGSALCIAVSNTPGQKPEMINNQIGKFNDGGAVDTSYLITSGSAANQAQCIARNYAAFAGTMSEYNKVLSENGVTDPFNDKEYSIFATKKS